MNLRIAAANAKSGLAVGMPKPLGRRAMAGEMPGGCGARNNRGARTWRIIMPIAGADAVLGDKVMFAG